MLSIKLKKDGGYYPYNAAAYVAGGKENFYKDFYFDFLEKGIWKWSAHKNWYSICNKE